DRRLRPRRAPRGPGPRLPRDRAPPGRGRRLRPAAVMSRTPRPRPGRPGAGRPGAGPEAARRPTAAAPPWWRQRSAVLGVAVVLAVTVACYLPSLRSGFTNWDDDLYVTQNTLIREISAENLWRVPTGPAAFNYH